jgi:hypothetical protein
MSVLVRMCVCVCVCVFVGGQEGRAQADLVLRAGALLLFAGLLLSVADSVLRCVCDVVCGRQRGACAGARIAMCRCVMYGFGEVRTMCVCGCAQ